MCNAPSEMVSQSYGPMQQEVRGLEKPRPELFVAVAGLQEEGGLACMGGGTSVGGGGASVMGVDFGPCLFLRPKGWDIQQKLIVKPERAP